MPMVSSLGVSTVKQPIVMMGFGTLPIPILNMYAHKVVDNYSGRIIKLSPINSDLNILQHYGFNSRDLTITGRVNLVNATSTVNYNTEAILYGSRILFESKTPVFVLLNHGAMYGIIESIKLIDDRDYPTAFDYEIRIVEKDFFGLKLTTLIQLTMESALGLFTTGEGYESFERLYDPNGTIPSWS